LATASLCLSADGRIPSHPSRLSYQPLAWNIPAGKPYRRTLSNGLKAYIVPDKTLPLIEIVGYIHAGTLSDPQGKEGLGSLAFQLMRTGGTSQYPADSLDELCERLAISISVSLTQSQGIFKASFLSEYADTALHILEQVLFHPLFEQQRFEQERAIKIDQIGHRFDDPGPILGAAYNAAMYPGEKNSRLSTENGLASITRQDLVDLHRNALKTDNITIGISGCFDTTVMIRRLEAIFPKPANIDSAAASFPGVSIAPQVKCLVIQKPISQSYVRLGLPLFKRPHPDYYAVSVLNLILGGNSFTSRLSTTVRSDEGLTYSIHSEAESNYTFPGTMYVSFFTKQESTNRAIALCIREMKKLVAQGITDEELSSAKKILVDALPSMFRSADDIAETYAWNEYYNRGDDHFTSYPDKINALTKKDIARVAQTWLPLDSLTFVVVGDTSVIFRQDASDGFSVRSLAPMSVLSPADIPAITKD
jgi:zinc protease